ncbi:MAG: hypothetical protein V1855_00705 [bacterium]
MKKQFDHSFAWALWGSIVFEMLKIGQNIALLHLSVPPLYGLIGSVFAIIYLAVRIADFGATNTLAPYFHTLMASKAQCKKILLYGFLGPALFMVAITIGGALWFCSYRIALHNTLILFIVIPLVILFETLRLFFRQLLHMTFQSRQVIITELALFLFYLTLVWTPIIMLGVKPSLNLIFIPYLVDSTLAIGIFYLLFIKFYRKLPSEQSILETTFWSRFTKLRILNYFLRIGKNMFTSNLLTPLFALQFGLTQAGIFYFASILATSIQALVKATLEYAGNTLFAHVKTHEHKSKQMAFTMVADKLMLILIPISLFLIFNYKRLMLVGMHRTITNEILTLSGLYLAVTFTEFFFSLYEQFYILQEAVLTVVFIRALEFLAFYWVITLYSYTSPAMILVGTFMVRVVSFAFMAIIAYWRWNIKPKIRISFSYAIGCLGIALFCLLLLSIR